MMGYSESLNGHGDCTGRWRWSCWTLLFSWFGVVRLEVEYRMSGSIGPCGVTNYRKANVGEWQKIVESQSIVKEPS